MLLVSCVYLPQLFCRSVRVLCCFVHVLVVGRPKTDCTNMTSRTENLTDFDNRYDITNQVLNLPNKAMKMLKMVLSKSAVT